MNPRKPITKHIITMGDSLTDRGTMSKRKLLGLIPLSYLIGITDDSPKGRFTNGYAWDDDLGAMLASMMIANEFKKSMPDKSSAMTMDDTDIADDVIDEDFVLVSQINRAYSLNDDKLIRYKGDNFLRSYAEAGLSAHDYSRDYTFSSRLFAREMVSTLSAKRIELLNDDLANKTTSVDKWKHW